MPLCTVRRLILPPSTSSLHYVFAPRHGAHATSAGEPGRGPGGGNGRRKLHVSPQSKRRIPQPHPDPDPTRARQQDCHPGENIPQRQVMKDDGGREQRREICCSDRPGDVSSDETKEVRRRIAERDFFWAGANKMGKDS